MAPVRKAVKNNKVESATSSQADSNGTAISSPSRSALKKAALDQMKEHHEPATNGTTIAENGKAKKITKQPSKSKINNEKMSAESNGEVKSKKEPEKAKVVAVAKQATKGGKERTSDQMTRVTIDLEHVEHKENGAQPAGTKRGRTAIKERTVQEKPQEATEDNPNKVKRSGRPPKNVAKKEEPASKAETEKVENPPAASVSNGTVVSPKSPRNVKVQQKKTTVKDTTTVAKIEKSPVKKQKLMTATTTNEKEQQSPKVEQKQHLLTEKSTKSEENGGSQKGSDSGSKGKRGRPAGAKKVAVEEVNNKNGEAVPTKKAKQGRPKKVTPEKSKTSEKKVDQQPKEGQESSSESTEEAVAESGQPLANTDKTTADNRRYTLKIACWNVAGVRSWLKKGHGRTYLTSTEKPDIFFVQETKLNDDEEMKQLEKFPGYHFYFAHTETKKGYAGVGLYSKIMPMTVKYGIGKPEHDGEGRVITAEYEKFYLVGVYVPNSSRGLVRLEYRQEWNEAFLEYLKSLDAKKPVICCGDMNVAHQEIDLANPKTNRKNAGFTDEERSDFSKLLDSGFTDAFRKMYPKQTGAYTFWTNTRNCREKNIGWRLDYFLISQKLEKDLCDCLIRDQVMGSDHCPLTLFMAF